MTKALPPKSLVLYADDDADDRELISEAFAEFSTIIDLITFEDGQELLGFLHHRDPLQPGPCLVILDVNMPMLDGKRTLEELRSLDGCKDVPVVLFTTSTLPADASFARSHQAGFVTKPIHTEQIQAIVTKMIEHCADDIKDKIRRQRGS